MNYHGLNKKLVTLFTFCFFALFVFSVEAACPVVERTIERSACPDSNPNFSGGGCSSSCSWPRPCSTCRIGDCNVCTAAETLDEERGVCISIQEVSTGRPACPSSNPFFRGSGCSSSCSWPRPCSTCRLEDCNTCRADETLDTEDGQCCSG